MKAITNFVRKKNMLFKLVLSYVLVGFLFMGGFSYIVLSKVSENMTEEINETSERMIDQSYNNADILLTSTYNYYSQLFTNNEIINNAMYGTAFSPIDIYKINNSLSDFTQTNPLVSSIYIYNVNSGLVFTSDRSFSTLDQFYDQDIIKLLQQNQFGKQGIFIPRKATFSFPGNNSITESHNYISIVYSNLHPDGQRDGMIVNLNQKVLQELMTKGSSETTHMMMIINNEGKIITHPDGKFLIEKKENPAYLQSVLEAREMRGRLLSREDGKELMISYVKSDRLGWIFVSVADYDELLSKLDTLKAFILWVTIGCLASMTVTSVFFTRIIYAPIYRLIKRMMKTADETKDQAPLNEYDLLSKSFFTLEHKLSALQTDVNQSLEARKKDFLRSILQGTIVRGTDIQESIDRLGIDFKSGKFLVCVMKVDAFHPLSEKYDMVDISLLKYAIANISQEIMAAHYPLETLADGHDALDLILNVSRAGETDKPSVELLLQQVQLNVEKFLKITVTVSVGPIVGQIEELAHSRQGADQAAYYRLTYGTNSLIAYSDIVAENKGDYHYPVSLEKQIMDCLKAGDLERLKEVSAEFIEAIQSFGYDEMLLSLDQLMVMTIRTAKGMASFDSSDADLEIHTSQRQLMRLDTLEQIEASYVTLCERIILARDRQSQSRNKKIIEKMIAYIEENYTNSNLSVEMLAQMIGLTADYFRRMFKEETGQSVSGYIAEIRYKKAEELLLMSEYPVNKIGELVGFDNIRYFSSQFKKRFGKTPDLYRKDNKLNTIV